MKKVRLLMSLFLLSVGSLAGCGQTDEKDNPKEPEQQEETCAHDLQHFDAEFPTCVEEGTKAYDKCKKCNKFYINGIEVSQSDLIIPISTDYSAHNLTHCDATGDCLTEGLLEHDVCTRCGKMFVGLVEKTAQELSHKGDHSLSPISEIPSTCATQGVKAHDHCSKCGKDFINGVEKTADELKLPLDTTKHNYSIVHQGTPTCGVDGGSPTYYECACGALSLDSAGQNPIAQPPSKVARDVLHSVHDFGEDHVCKVCGNKDISFPVVKTGEDGEISSAKSGGVYKSITYALNNPGKWAAQIASKNCGSSDLVENGNYLYAQGGENVYFQTVPNQDILENGGVFFASFDITPPGPTEADAKGQIGCFQFGTGVSGTSGNWYVWETAPVNECVVGKTYHVEVIVKLQAGCYWQISFKNDTNVTPNANVRAKVENIKLLQLGNSDTPVDTVTGINVVSAPWTYTMGKRPK